MKGSLEGIHRIKARNKSVRKNGEYVVITKSKAGRVWMRIRDRIEGRMHGHARGVAAEQMGVGSRDRSPHESEAKMDRLVLNGWADRWDALQTT